VRIIARITVEHCRQKIPNGFELIILGVKPAKQLFKGTKPLLDNENCEIVTALCEIATGRVRKKQNNLETRNTGDAAKSSN